MSARAGGFGQCHLGRAARRRERRRRAHAGGRRTHYHARVQRRDFAYSLPEELIAQTPLAERSASRLLVLDGDTGTLADRTIRELPLYLRDGDLLVFNDTRVIAARVLGSKASGGRVELFLERVVDDGHALVQMRASKPIREGMEVHTPGGIVRVVAREEELWRVATPQPALSFFESWGEVPLPPYIHRAADDSDRDRYQSIFARDAGAVAAPTASLHFDPKLVEDIESRGVKFAFVTLHVGAGTFQPIRVDDLESHVMHAERVTVKAATCDAITRTRAAGGRIIAVGTTVVRALETAAAQAARTLDGQRNSSASESSSSPPMPAETQQRAFSDLPSLPAVPAAMRDTVITPYSGDTRLFIRPGFRFNVVDMMLTNFHLPESTLLMLVCAFAGREHTLAAYEHAIQQRYRFFSYGDAMLVTPTHSQ